MKALPYKLQLFFIAGVFSYLIFSACTEKDAILSDAETRKEICAVADAVVRDATFRFKDLDTGQIYNSPEDAPALSNLWPESAYTDWRYWNGVLNLAMLNLSDVLREPQYAEFVPRNIAFCFDHYQFFEDKYKNEGKWNYPFGQLFIMEELDDCGAMGASLIKVYGMCPREQYLEYIEKAASHMMFKQDRLADGTLVRSFPRQWTVWADDLYMGIVFLVRMYDFSKDHRYLDDAVHQVISYHKYLFNEEKGLMHHCWYSDTQSPGIAFWGRANGWALLAQVDLLDRLPVNDSQADTLRTLFQKHIKGITRYQSQNGLWHQLIDKPDSYLGTSCSSIFTYVIARAVNKGYIGKNYKSLATKGWKGVSTKIHPDGQFEGVCTGTGIGDDLEFYYNRPTPLNDVHGTGFILLAGAEILLL